jgi:glycerol kinase
MQVHADVSNIPISFTKVGEGPILGSAMLGAVGAEIYRNVHEAPSNMVHVESSLRYGLGQYIKFDVGDEVQEIKAGKSHALGA